MNKDNPSNRPIVLGIGLLALLLIGGIAFIALSAGTTNTAVITPVPMATAMPTVTAIKIVEGKGEITIPRSSDDPKFIQGRALINKNDSRIQGLIDVPLSDCIIFLNNAPKVKDASTLPPATLDFIPAALSTTDVFVQIGQKLTITNKDRIARGFSLLCKKNPPQSRAFPQPSMSSDIEFDQAERFIVFADTVYTWITPTKIHVFDNQYYSVSDLYGKFKFPAPPPGKYLLICESELYGRLKKEIEIESEDSAPFIEIMFNDSPAQGDSTEP